MSHPSPRTDLRGLLEKVEAASPIDAVEVVADELAVMVGARAVRFLIADFSGHRVVRFGELTSGVAAGRLDGAEDAESVKLAGTVYERVLRTQRVDVRHTGEGALLTVPVTAAIPRRPGRCRRRGRRACPGLCRRREPPSHRSVRVGSAHDALHTGRRDPAAVVAEHLYL